MPTPTSTRRFSLLNAGNPKSRKRSKRSGRRASSATPRRCRGAAAVDFALNECPTFSQIGWVGVRGLLRRRSPSRLRSRTALRHGTVGRRNGPLRLHGARHQHPDQASRSRFGPAPTTGSPSKSRASPRRFRSTEAEIEVWGFPIGCRSTTSCASRRALRANPPAASGSWSPTLKRNLPGLRNRSLPGVLVRPLIDNPTVCIGQPAADRTDGPQLQGPGTRDDEDAEYPPTTDCATQVFRPVFNVGLTTDEADAPSGLNLQLIAKQTLGLTNSPSELRSAFVKFPVGFSVNPDAADGQLSCSDDAGQLRQRRTERMPRHVEDRDGGSDHAGAERAAGGSGSTSANRSPATSTACSWSSTASASTPSWRRRSSRTRRPASSPSRCPTCRRSPSNSSTCTSSPPTAG